MPHHQPTVRQLQPLGRRYHSIAAMREPAAASAREAGTGSPDPVMSAPRRPRWRRWLTARPSPTS